MATIGGKRMGANDPVKKGLPNGYSIAEEIMADRAKRGRGKDNAFLEKTLKKAPVKKVTSATESKPATKLEKKIVKKLKPVGKKSK